jgi:hypothetical protein
MPRVTVELQAADGRTEQTVLDETISPAELESDRSAAAFIERLGWAIVDADDHEGRLGEPPGLGV